MSVELLGYSERGIINAICEDIHHCPDPHLKVTDFLSWFEFPDTSLAFVDEAIVNATLLVEQKFADFGDLDLLVLIEFQSGKKRCFLIEAKVSNDTNSWKTINSRWDEFTDQLCGKSDNTSNLLVQLHRKVRLVEKLRGGRNFATDCLIPKGRLGDNQVVAKACNKLKGFLSEDKAAWFGAILPDPQESLNSFARTHFGALPLGTTLPTWSTERWGVLSWHVVAQKVGSGGWPRTKATLEWNDGQIFRKAPPVINGVESNSFAMHDDRPVYVVERDKHNCRVIYLDAPDYGYFWNSSKVRLVELDGSEEQIVASKPNLPRSGSDYTWDSRNEVPVLPEGELIDGLTDGSRVVVVKRPSWLTTRVKLSDGTADTFLVFTHQLRRS